MKSPRKVNSTYKNDAKMKNVAAHTYPCLIRQKTLWGEDEYYPLTFTRDKD